MSAGFVPPTAPKHPLCPPLRGTNPAHTASPASGRPRGLTGTPPPQAPRRCPPRPQASPAATDAPPAAMPLGTAPPGPSASGQFRAGRGAVVGGASGAAGGYRPPQRPPSAPRPASHRPLPIHARTGRSQPHDPRRNGHSRTPDPVTAAAPQPPAVHRYRRPAGHPQQPPAALPALPRPPTGRPTTAPKGPPSAPTAIRLLPPAPSPRRRPASFPALHHLPRPSRPRSPGLRPVPPPSPPPQVRHPGCSLRSVRARLFARQRG